MTKEALIAKAKERKQAYKKNKERLRELCKKLPFLKSDCLLDELFVAFAERIAGDEEVKAALTEIGGSATINVMESAVLKIFGPIFATNDTLNVSPEGNVVIAAETTPDQIRRFLEMTPAAPATASTEQVV